LFHSGNHRAGDKYTVTVSCYMRGAKCFEAPRGYRLLFHAGRRKTQPAEARRGNLHSFFGSVSKNGRFIAKTGRLPAYLIPGVCCGRIRCIQMAPLPERTPLSPRALVSALRSQLYRWVQAYTPKLKKRIRPYLRLTNDTIQFPVGNVGEKVLCFITTKVYSTYLDRLAFPIT
jgi:hypothetical protein